MGLLAIDTLAEGMVLASAVHDRSGRLLLDSDTELTAKHLRMFRTWGISEADIVGIEEQGSAATHDDDVDPELLKKVEGDLRRLFCNANLDYPVMEELFRLCLLRKVRHESR